MLLRIFMFLSGLCFILYGSLALLGGGVIFGSLFIIISLFCFFMSAPIDWKPH